VFKNYTEYFRIKKIFTKKPVSSNALKSYAFLFGPPVR